MKTPKCKHCGGEHYSTFCFQAPRKPLQVRKPLQAKKPIQRRVSPLKNSRLKQKSDNPRPIAIEKLDRVFSTYIRLKDAKEGMAVCVTCGLRDNYKSLQNGHYFSRRKMSVRWDEMNCHVQCSNCNESLGGNMVAYKAFMLRTYGQEALDDLQLKSQVTDKLSISEIDSQTDYYKKLVKGLQDV